MIMETYSFRPSSCPSLLQYLQLSGLALQVQPESHTVMCLRTMSLRGVGEWIEMGGEESEGKKMQNLS